ncbi:MAG TPA: flagellin [Tepidisphaeraceae bacterium]|jgi:flagellin-like hook-associated protein FlgL|nr:flagellin [Tepidisphaeraceae bacterium]
MSSIPSNLARVSNNLRASVTTSALSKTQAQLLQVENQISTGLKISVPSDDPGSAAIIMQLQKTLEASQGFLNNISTATTQLQQVDSTVSNVTDSIQQAISIASSDVGTGSTDQQRSDDSAIVQNLYTQMLSYGNTQINGTYIFGGNGSNTAPFVQALGGVQFVGSNTPLSNAVDQNTTSALSVSASSVFGQVSTPVPSSATLTPRLDGTTRISDLAGATGSGVHLGSIVLSDGTTSKTIDLSGANSVDDVINRINNAGVGSITAGVDASGTSLELSTTGADNITVTDVGTGTTASDLGILRNVGAGAGAPLTGASVNAKLTALSPTNSINGGSLDLSSGIIITNGAQSATLDFSNDSTIGDVLNTINNSGTGVQAKINSAGTGIEVSNLVQGTALTIGENGGNTATSLGIRSFNSSTLVSSLNGGTGIRSSTVASDPDLRITQSDGTSFDVDLSAANTVGDIMSAINSAAAGAGSSLTASLASTGNGITLTDNSGGGSPFTIDSLNGSTAAQDLGFTNAASGNTLTSTDVNPVYASGVFAHLANLQAALQKNDQAGITAAGAALQADYTQAVKARGLNGANLQNLTTRQNTLTDQNTATTTALSNLQDVDFTDAITRFQTLQTSLQASLQAAGQTINLSLLDFLS